MTEVYCPICNQEVTVEDISPTYDQRIGIWARTGHVEEKNYFIVRCGCPGVEMPFTLGIGLDSSEYQDRMKESYVDVRRMEMESGER